MSSAEKSWHRKIQTVEAGYSKTERGREGELIFSNFVSALCEIRFEKSQVLFSQITEKNKKIQQYLLFAEKR